MTAQDTDTPPSFDRRAIPDGAIEALWSAADGWNLRRMDWPEQAEPPRGSLLFLPGRADFFEKYLESLDHWHRIGWRVAALDWRGQGFSGRLGKDAFTGHVSDFSVWAEDLAAFWNDWTARTPAPHIVVAHSMGAHILLRCLSEGCVKPEAAVVTAPMLGLQPRWVPSRVAQGAARFMGWLRGQKTPAWKGNERPDHMPGDRLHLLTHDADRYADEAFWRSERPELALGAPSWGWLERAFDSMRYLRRPGVLERIGQPVLFVTTTADRLVDYRAMEAAAKRIPNARLVTFGPEARHEILREADVVREKALAEIDSFLNEVAPAQA